MTTDDARERILAAAERCIERHGIRKTTMDDVASEVGLSRPSVYRYFADRDDLLVELIMRHARVINERAQSPSPGRAAFRIRSLKVCSTSPTTPAATR